MSNRELIERSMALLQRGNASMSDNDSAPSAARPLRDWLDNPEILCPPVVIIPHLAVEGRATLLSGREKIGKSTLAAGAASAVSLGQDVLGTSIGVPIRSLWYALDEHPADAVRRFSALGADLDGIVVNDKPRTVSELLAAFERDLETFDDVGVIWVDTLSRILAVSGVDPNSSHDVEPVIAQLVDVCHSQNISGVFLYHTGKSGREYRGSTAIGATVDEVLTLRRRGQSEDDDFDDDSADDGRRLLVQDGRNLRGRVHLTCVAGVYRLYDEACPPRQRIIETLRDHGTVTGRAELTKLAGVRKSAGLKAIADLIAEDSVIETGRQLKLAVPKMARVPMPLHTRERTANAAGVPGSARFPEEGTTTEPRREPDRATSIEAGSRFGKGGVTDSGTPLPTQIIERDGQQVVQTLRPTQHGDRWFDVGAA